MCVGMNANARQERLRLLLLFVTIISSMIQEMTSALTRTQAWSVCDGGRRCHNVGARGVCVCVCGSLCVCVCVSLGYARACVCGCVQMDHGRLRKSIGERESNVRSNCHVWLCECALQMQFRQL